MEDSKPNKVTRTPVTVSDELYDRVMQRYVAEVGFSRGARRQSSFDLVARHALEHYAAGSCVPVGSVTVASGEADEQLANKFIRWCKAFPENQEHQAVVSFVKHLLEVFK